jgi:hypothetical protein
MAEVKSLFKAGAMAIRLKLLAPEVGLIRLRLAPLALTFAVNLSRFRSARTAFSSVMEDAMLGRRDGGHK